MWLDSIQLYVLYTYVCNLLDVPTHMWMSRQQQATATAGSWQQLIPSQSFISHIVQIHTLIDVSQQHYQSIGFRTTLVFITLTPVDPNVTLLLYLTGPHCCLV